MDWAGWALFGLVATAALTAVMIMAQLAGLTRLDPADAYGRLAAFGPSRPGVRLNMIASVDGADLARAVSALAKRGHANVLSEGGPGVAAQPAAGGARRILDGAALAPPSVLALGQVLEADGYQFLRYRRR